MTDEPLTPAVAPDGRRMVHAETREAWRTWLAAHYSEPDGVWLVSWKKASGRPAVPYGEAVEEALCVGWIDSKPAKLDADRSLLWFSPRRPKSGWSRPNKERIERLEAAGLLTAAGRATIEAAKADGTWTMLDAVEAMVVPDDLIAAFGAHPGAADAWESFPPSARRGILQWIVQAKRPETRAQRVAETAERASRGERANQWPRP